MKKILIIGATSTIAGACARLWAADHASFLLVGRDPAKLRALQQDLEVRGATAAQTRQMDAQDTSAYAPTIAAAIETLGKIDIALIAHGSLPNQSACEHDPEQVVSEFVTNAVSVVALLTLLANEFERQRAGTIAVITSVAGERGRRSNYVYGSAKGAVSIFCDGLRARLLKSGVRMVDIRPGFVATPMTQGLPLPSLLVAQPEKVARRIVAGIDRGTAVLHAPAYWAAIMAVIRLIPRWMFVRMNL